ncbi:hypothetical protein BBO99_00001597 [Phytophthora kernoviae]|uniref:NTF2 domain-containing protein n=2 Tax=Phytophthora kernoviae TaxID=325452 RepID=A0A3R7JXW9_9STRA|nr:hypothetical protein G195_005838 [Phytophthora kernoviae 00238/432]KAG2529418.1 hypothetical protein JM16_000809 [Phytophthora kernoviae]KAG2531412.1 hypothetical protein JM18_001214 [Phytophthora kernoviae]RLN38097.1 hypothetical protein BBI17_001815 [Phytophthora kernoviae]RLN84076.1 hypothetical protein BBO99_00001597 [Phytophthora kernoviae]
MVNDGAASPVITTLEDASAKLETLRTLTASISEAAASPTLKTEQDYITGVVPQLDEATATYQTLAAFLREHKRSHNEGAGFRDVQRAFVRVMQELQTAQRGAAARREALCDADFIAGNGLVAISAQDIQTAKEEVLEAGEIAQEAAAVNALFRQVGTLVSEQGHGVDQIATKVEAIRVEIGKVPHQVLNDIMPEMSSPSTANEEQVPAPNTVGNTFMRQYYHFLAKDPQSLHRFYKNESRWCHGVGSHMEEPIAGQRAINDQILKRGYAGARVDLDAGSIDCQNSLGGGVLVLVTGVMTLRSSPEPKPFVQTFFLAVQPKGYFVLNDCLRFLELPGTSVESEKEIAAVATPVSPKSNGNELTVSPKKTVEKIETKKDLSPIKTETKTTTTTVKKVVKETPVSPVKATATVASSPVKKTMITTTTKTTKPEKKEEAPVKAPASPAKVSSPVKPTAKTASPPKPPIKSPKKQEKPVAAAPAATAEPVVAAPTEPEKPKTWAALFNSKAPASVTPSSATTVAAPIKPATPKAASTPAPAPAAITPAAGAPTAEKSPKNKSGNGKEKEGSRPRLYSLFIRDVPSQTRENDLRELFKSYGSIAGVNVNQRGYAFVDYHEEKSMRAALAETTELRLFDKVLQVGERGERKEGQRGSFRSNDSRGRGRGHGPKSGRGERKERNGEDASANKGDRREGPRREKTGNRRGGKTEGAPHSQAE